eukprot:TRINITY_DN1821_c0_g1_i2.p1 TRINITY_DN1821_c0_g1~~TRINITY_DN1821_c0_g1_i2.p1  ORF type:complete len:1318 (-),score=394.48 TRINITY_DN1821_c0_g1_i2:1168-5121(-)
MPLTDANPFFQEFTHTFTDQNLGMRIRKVNGMAIVQELVRTRHGFKAACEKSRVPIGALIVAVNRDRVFAQGYEETVSRVKTTSRPLVVTFRQLHAAEDPEQPRRYWQGYLRCKAGDQLWTGRFYVLTEDGCLRSYPGKDITATPPVETVVVGDSTIVHGDALRQFAGRLLDDDDGLVWAQTFALLLQEQLLFFRADSTEAKLDWVAALTVLHLVRELQLDPLPATKDTHQQQQQQQQQPRSRAGSEATALHTNAPASGVPSSESSPNAGNTVAIGTQQRPAANCIKAGYLHKRSGSKLWDTTPLHMAKTAIKLQPWNSRWVALLDDGRLLWHRAPPADAMEVPSGQLLLRGAAVSCAETDMLKHLREDEAKGTAGFPIMIRTGTRLLFLRAKTASERLDWMSVMLTMAEAKGAVFSRIADDVEAHRQEVLRALQENPMSLFDDQEVAYSFMVSRAGHSVGGGGCTAEEFCATAGQHFLLLCDAHTAPLVFDALTHDGTGDETEPLPEAGVANSLTHLMADSGESDDADTRTVRSTPLAGCSRPRLGFATFTRYAQSLQACIRHGDMWTDLRLKLGLDPFEILIKQADYIAETGQLSGLANSGTMFMTDRHLFFMGMRSEVRVVPLGSVKEVVLSGTQLGGRALQDAITLTGATVHTVQLQAGGTAGGQRLQEIVNAQKSNAVIGDYRLVFSKLRELMSLGVKTGRRRQVWHMFLTEIVEAHHMAAAGATDDLPEGIEDSRLDTLPPSQPGIGATVHSEVQEGSTAESDHGAVLKRSWTTAGYGYSATSGGGSGSGGSLINKASLARPEIWSKLGAKIRVLLQEEKQGLEAYHVQRHALRLWVASNLIRTRALTHVTGRDETALLVCTRARTDPRAGAVLRTFLDQEAGSKGGRTSGSRRGTHSRGYSVDLGALAEGLATVGEALQLGADEGRNTVNIPSGVGGVGSLAPEPPPKIMMFTRWLHVLASHMAQAQALRDRKKQALRNFTPQKFKSEWEMFWELVDPVMEGLVQEATALIEWQRPLVSFTVMWVLLTPAWHDAMHLVPAMAAVACAGALLLNRDQEYVKGESVEQLSDGAAMAVTDDGPSQSAHQQPTSMSQQPQPQRPSRRASSPTRLFGFRTAERGLKDDAGAAASSGSSATASTNNSAHTTSDAPQAASSDTDQDSVDAANPPALVRHKVPLAPPPVLQAQSLPPLQPQSQQPPPSQQPDGLLKRVKDIQAKAGTMQAKLHAYNVALLKLRSLVAWTDPTRTKVFVLFLLFAALLLATIPLRYTWAGAVVFLFTKPLRSMKKTVPELVSTVQIKIAARSICVLQNT